jgi:hypothetical protein
MLFRRKRKADDHPIKDKAAKSIAGFLLKIQSRFSDFMNASTKNIPAKNIKIILIAFCLFGGGFSIYLIGEAILKPDKEQKEYKIDQVNVPKYYDRNGNEELEADQYVDQETYQRIEAFERYMDSLAQNTTGRTIHDSILIVRPGLMDSLKMLKEIYQSQLK